jgi:hypothetical protein
MLPHEFVGAWIAAGLTLIMYSFLYKDNPLFRLGEHLYVGLSVGYGFCYSLIYVVWPDLIYPLYRTITNAFGHKWEEALQPNENFWLLIPFFFGIFMLTRFSNKTSWMSRWTFAFITGATSGMAIPLVFSADIFKQIVPTLQPLYQPGQTPLATLSETSGIILILIGVLTVLIYFFFSAEHKGTIGVISRIGIFYMMVSFGAAFGYTVMGRETLAIARFQKLIEWGKEKYFYASIILLFVVALLIFLFEIIHKRSNNSKTTATKP